MTDTEIYVEVEAVKAEIEGMKAENLRRESVDKSQAYGESAFIRKADEIRALIDKEAKRPCLWSTGCPIVGIGCSACGAKEAPVMSKREAKVWWKNRLSDNAIKETR